MQNLTIYDASGILGSIIFLGAYAALQLGYLRGRGYAYAALNALGASFVLASIIQISILRPRYSRPPGSSSASSASLATTS
ncbi:MAG: hypothetical protein M5U09_10255 [Gammaproteobacteria bacterium]|nr:hypothetical protein [Gammaproteobacteria bacterium]